MWCEDGWSEHLATIINGIDPWEHVICISEFTKSDLCNYRQDLDPRKVSVAYLGASEAFRPCNEKDMIAAIRRKYGILDGSYVLAVSNQAPHKNFGMLIESFGKMIHEQNIRDLSLVITGDAGWKRESIMEALSRWNVARRRIVLTGYVPDEELPALYGGAQSFVFPSLYEGFGLPVLEAMQCGTPVISSHASSLPEVVGDAGLLFDPRDSDALSEAMLKIYRSQSLRQELSEKSLRRAKLFSWKRCADDTVSAYERAIRGG
jgi:glycosyltransferase involved in cell wall biosynthesis